MTQGPEAAGILVVDKPAGLTSQDVVARARRALGMRRVGHAGTLDPMATGVLVVGFGRATRLLTYVVGVDKAYRATIRLGWSSDTDDADGSVRRSAEASALSRIRDDDITVAMATLAASRVQVPSSVSAVKVAGKRAYQRVRSGESVTLAAREVVIHRFESTSIRRSEVAIDIDAEVECGSGTYVRALARDLGGVLGVGGHLTALRRTRVGSFHLEHAVDLADLERAPGTVGTLSPATAAEMILPTWMASDEAVVAVRHGRRIPWPADVPRARTAVMAPRGDLVAVVEPADDRVRSLTVFADNVQPVPPGAAAPTPARAHG